MMNTLHIIAAIFVSALLTHITIPVIVRISALKTLLDNPNERKVNKLPVPNLGGVAMFFGVTISILLVIENMEFLDFRYILAAMILLFFVGIKDDILILSARTKFIAQFIAAGFLAILGNIRLTNLHGIFGIGEINYWFSVALSLVVIVGIINAMNLIDGIDGLAGGLGMMISTLFGAIFILFGQLQYAILCFALVGSLMSFLFYNVFGKTNKIFMGDTGSLMLGLLVAVMVIKYNEIAIGSANEAFSPAISIAIVFVPLFDMVRVFCIRMMNMKSPFKPDMNHIHHRFLQLGHSHLVSSLLIITINLLIIALIALLRGLNIHILLGILFGLGIIFTYSLRLWAHRKSGILKSQHEMPYSDF
jgi:UDP-N-acetylmuramyl pentapeptide phosphotransferase/UDP-N-acetylglucosamine-1-phosphate transferase